MNNSKLPAAIFLLMLLVALFESVHLYPQLPERMASHFAANGQPNGWQSKQDFFLLTAIVVLVCSVVSFVLPLTIAVVPTELVNLPNKSYWLAPERRAQTVGMFAAHMAWFGCGLLFVTLYAVSQAIQANLPVHAPFNSIGLQYVLIGFILFAVPLLIHLIRRFSSPPGR